MYRTLPPPFQSVKNLYIGKDAILYVVNITYCLNGYSFISSLHAQLLMSVSVNPFISWNLIGELDFVEVFLWCYFTSVL